MCVCKYYLLPLDLKPENILYESPDENANLKLADFGLATLLRPNQLMTVACGTPGYVAFVPPFIYLLSCFNNP